MCFSPWAPVCIQTSLNLGQSVSGWKSVSIINVSAERSQIRSQNNVLLVKTGQKWHGSHFKHIFSSIVFRIWHSPLHRRAGPHIHFHGFGCFVDVVNLILTRDCFFFQLLSLQIYHNHRSHRPRYFYTLKIRFFAFNELKWHHRGCLAVFHQGICTLMRGERLKVKLSLYFKSCFSLLAYLKFRHIFAFWKKFFQLCNYRADILFH